MLGVLAAGCGDDNGSSPATTEAEGGHAIGPDSAVTAGLTASIATAKELAGQAATGKVPESGFERLHSQWEAYEGTVKQNEVDIYLSLEDDLNAIQKATTSGDAAGSQKAVTDFETHAKQYLAKHP